MGRRGAQKTQGPALTTLFPLSAPLFLHNVLCSTTFLKVKNVFAPATDQLSHKSWPIGALLSNWAFQLPNLVTANPQSLLSNEREVSVPRPLARFFSSSLFSPWLGCFVAEAGTVAGIGWLEKWQLRTLEFRSAAALLAQARRVCSRWFRPHVVVCVWVAVVHRWHYYSTGSLPAASLVFSGACRFGESCKFS